MQFREAGTFLILVADHLTMTPYSALAMATKNSIRMLFEYWSWIGRNIWSFIVSHFQPLAPSCSWFVCFITKVWIETQRWFYPGPTSELCYRAFCYIFQHCHCQFFTFSSMAIANIAHAGKTELPVVLSHDVRLVLSPTINPQQKSNTLINIVAPQQNQ